MTETTRAAIRSKIQDWLNLTAVATLVALALSLYNFYRSYLYVSEVLDVTVTELSYVTNKGELYAVLAFSNPGNRDAAVLRVEPLLWASREGKAATWEPLVDKVSEIPLTAPRTPMVVHAGGVEVVTLTAQLDPKTAEAMSVSNLGGAFVGVRVSTMNASGNLYQVEHSVALLKTGEQGAIVAGEPTLHRTLPGFSDTQGPPPGEIHQPTKQTPFVWAEEHWRTDDE